jgi:hypothetical protein
MQLLSIFSLAVFRDGVKLSGFDSPDYPRVAFRIPFAGVKFVAFQQPLGISGAGSPIETRS